MADDAANITLDLHQDGCYAHTESINRARSASVNYRICLDGAKRGSGSASAAMVGIAHYDTGEPDL